ncbi:dual specificity protein phosphatase family protein [Candidatus Uhrbacteria bacterium]|nr:dual specificity protein phosphatase family protein [Candidatus Uhrbacteria bacterium]
MGLFSFLNAKDNHSNGTPPFEFSQITDQVFIGTNACCRVHFEDRLLKLGVSADISLEEKRIDHPFGIDAYLWLPTKDHTPPSRENADVGISALKKLLEQGRKVYIHCQNGHGRGPTLFAAYLISTGMKPDDAIALIAAKRPATHLEPSQIDFLRASATMPS